MELESGGSGAGDWQYAYQSKELSGLKMGAPTGGELTFKRFYATDYGANAIQQVIGRRRTGNPTPYKIPLTIPNYVTPTIRTVLQNMEGVKNIRIRAYNGKIDDRNAYQVMYGWINAVNTNQPGAFEGDILNGEDTPADLAKRLWPQEADAYVEWWPVSHARLANVGVLAINQAIAYGFKRNAGDIVGEVGNNDGLQEYLMVTAADAGLLPHIYYTTNKGASLTDRTGTGLTNFSGTGIALVGENVVISGISTGGGLAWTKLNDLLAGAVTPTRSTGISAGTLVNAVARITGQKAIACGTAGAVYTSSDGGKTFASAGTAVTANSLTWIVVVDETLQYLGGASGTLVRRKNGVMTVLTAGGWSTTALNCGAVPGGMARSTQLFVGTAAGDVYFTADATVTSPTWSVRKAEGSGAIDALAFAGYDGNTLYYIWTNGSTQSVVKRDFTGGYFGQVEDIGTVTSPANSSFNSLAVPVASGDVNTVLVVGDANGGTGYIGLVA